MRWIKASERLPETSGHYYCKMFAHTKELIWFNKGLNGADNIFKREIAEWLDESPISQDDDGFQIRIGSLLSQIKIRDAEIQSLKEALKAETECTDHIKEVCDNYEKEIQSLKQENEKAIEILTELCQLKYHKDTMGKDSFYQTSQPEAWRKANVFLNAVTLKQQST